MKTFSHLWQYLVKFFLEWGMSQTTFVEKIKTHILCSITFFRKSCRLWDNVKKCVGARGATNDVTVWRVRRACCISKATRAHRMHMPTHQGTDMHARTHKYVMLIAFPLQQWCANTPECCDIRTLPFFLHLVITVQENLVTSGVSANSCSVVPSPELPVVRLRVSLVPPTLVSSCLENT